MKIQNSTAFVTGANRGLGLAYAKALLAAGARKVYAGARDPSSVPALAGLVPVNAEGIARVSFAPDHPISKADKFAISVEPAGGVPKATGPIVLLGGN